MAKNLSEKAAALEEGQIFEAGAELAELCSSIGTTLRPFAVPIRPPLDTIFLRVCREMEIRPDAALAHAISVYVIGHGGLNEAELLAVAERRRAHEQREREARERVEREQRDAEERAERIERLEREAAELEARRHRDHEEARKRYFAEEADRRERGLLGQREQARKLVASLESAARFAPDAVESLDARHDADLAARERIAVEDEERAAAERDRLRADERARDEEAKAASAAAIASAEERRLEREAQRARIEARRKAAAETQQRA